MSKAILYFASSAHIGLTDHCARQASDLKDKIMSECDFYVVSSEKEQNAGLWMRVERAIPAEHIIKFSGELKNNIGLHANIQKIVGSYDKVFFHLQGASQAWFCRNWLKLEKCSALVIVNSFANGTWKRVFVSFIFSLLALRFVNHMVFLSPFACRSFVGSKMLLHNGIAKFIPFVLPNDSSNILSRDDVLPLPSEQFHVVYFASYFKNKGHERFLPGLIAFAQNHADVRIHFWGNRNSRTKKIEHAIAVAGCSKQIFCHDRIPRTQVPRILACSAIALSLSKSENAGHVGIEAMMQRVPVIGTRVGSLEFLLQDGITGFGVSNQEQLRMALETLYKSPELRKQIGERACKTVAGFFDYSSMLLEFTRLYQDF